MNNLSHQEPLSPSDWDGSAVAGIVAILLESGVAAC
jgi:hypothetical protein